MQTIQKEQKMSKLAAVAGLGLDSIQDTRMPTIKLAQSMTPEAQKGDAACIKGLEAGMFFNSDTKEVFGATIRVVVLAASKAYFLNDDDRKFKGVVNAYDASWVRDATGVLRTTDGYRVQTVYQYIVMPLVNTKLGTPAMFSLRATDTQAARDWNTMMKRQVLSDGKTPCPIFGQVWELTSAFRKNDKGGWYAISDGSHTHIRPIGEIPDSMVDELVENHKTAKLFFEGYASSKQQTMLPPPEGQPSF